MSSLPRNEPFADGGERVLVVEFEALDGTRWSAVGSGREVGEAIASAREALPGPRAWRAVRVADLYGD
jgi:hypothetical protein